MLENLFLFVLGASIGSFINVVIARFPLNLSIVTPRSRCMSCKNQIIWKDNIPIYSWLQLKGKCRNCQSKISIQYFLIELMMGFIFVFVKYKDQAIYTGITDIHGMILSLTLISIFVPLIILDFKYFWLPSSLINLGIVSWFINLSIYSYLFNDFKYFHNIFAGFIGLISFFTISILGKLFLKKPILGFGDGKLSALIGLWLGLEGLLITIYLSYWISGIICVVLLISKKLKKGSIIPFGPFLLFSTLAVWFEGVEPLKKLILRY